MTPSPDAVSAQSTQTSPVNMSMMSSMSLPPTPRAVSQSLSVCVYGDRDFGVIWSSCSVRTSSRPSNTGNPLTSASQLCCGHMSVCIFLRHRSCVHVPKSNGRMGFFFFQEGGYSAAAPTNRPTDHSPKGRTQEKLNKHKHCLFLRTLIGWPIREPFFSLVPLLPYSALLFKEGLAYELWPLRESRKLSKRTRRETRFLFGMSWFGSLFPSPLLSSVTRLEAF